MIKLLDKTVIAEKLSFRLLNSEIGNDRIYRYSRMTREELVFVSLTRR